MSFTTQFTPNGFGVINMLMKRWAEKNRLLDYAKSDGISISIGNSNGACASNSIGNSNGSINNSDNNSNTYDATAAISSSPPIDMNRFFRFPEVTEDDFEFPVTREELDIANAMQRSCYN